MPTWQERFPEHAKLDKVKPESQAIGSFLDQAFEDGWLKPGPHLPRGGIEKVLAVYFGVDLDALEREKRNMLREMRDPATVDIVTGPGEWPA